MSKDKRFLKEEDIEETQKKYAEHLSEKTGESQANIEKGREEFLRRSAKGLPEQYKPPYGAVSWYERFLDMAQTQKLEVVDPEFISINIVDSHYKNQILRGLKFLGLVNENNRVTAKLRSLRVLGDEYKQRLKAVVQDAYRDVFSTVILQKAGITNLVNFFMQKYDFGASVARQVTDIFVMFCRRAGIELPFVSTTPDSVVRSRHPTTKRDTQKNVIRRTEVEETPRSGLYEIKYGKIQISLPEGDLDAASEAIELINMYIKRLEKRKSSQQKNQDSFGTFFSGSTIPK